MALQLLMLSSSKEVVLRMFLGKLIVKQHPGKMKNRLTLSVHLDISQFLYSKKIDVYTTYRVANLGSKDPLLTPPLSTKLTPMPPLN